jgi:hypothetical protein
MWKRLLRNTGIFLFLTLGIGTFFFLAATSGKGWPGLAVTIASSNPLAPATSSAQATSVQTTPARPASAPTAIFASDPFVQPIILQNPVLPDTHNLSKHKHSSHRYPPVYTPPPQPSTPPEDNSVQDPTSTMPGFP